MVRSTRVVLNFWAIKPQKAVIFFTNEMNLKRETEREPSSQNESGNVYFDCMADEFVSGLGLNFTMRDYKTETYMFAKKDEENDREEMKRKVLESERVIGAVNEVCLIICIEKIILSSKHHSTLPSEPCYDYLIDCFIIR